MGKEIWGRQLTTRVTQNEPKSKVSQRVYLHAGLEIGPAVSHAIQRESNEDCHERGSKRPPCHSAW